MKKASPKKPAHAHGCLADRQQARADSSKLPERTEWRLNIGFIKLYIDGPAEHHWFACSVPHYYGQVGTANERRIAERVVKILNREHADSLELQREHFDRIMVRAANELGLPTEDVNLAN